MELYIIIIICVIFFLLFLTEKFNNESAQTSQLYECDTYIENFTVPSRYISEFNRDQDGQSIQKYQNNQTECKLECDKRADCAGMVTNDNDCWTIKSFPNTYYKRGSVLHRKDPCDTNLNTRTSERDTCNTNLNTRTGERDTCNTNLNTRTSERDTCNTNLNTRTGERDTCNTNLTERTGERDTCNTNLNTRTGERDTFKTERDTCNTNLTERTEERDTCNSDLINRTRERDSCNSDLINRTRERDTYLDALTTERYMEMQRRIRTSSEPPAPPAPPVQLAQPAQPAPPAPPAQPAQLAPPQQTQVNQPSRGGGNLFDFGSLTNLFDFGNMTAMGNTNVTLAAQPQVLAQQTPTPLPQPQVLAQQTPTPLLQPQVLAPRTPTPSPYRKQSCCNGDTYTGCYLANKEWCVNSCRDINCDRAAAERAAIAAEKADAAKGVFYPSPYRKQSCCNGDTYTGCYLANKEWCVNSCKDENCDRNAALSAASAAERADAAKGIFWVNPPPKVPMP
jgi:hypothetical protein